MTMLATAYLVLAATQAEPLPRGVGGVEAEGTGTVSGIVLFEGKKPRARLLKQIEANPFCKERHPDGLPSDERTVFGRNGDRDTLQNVLVYVSKGLEEKAFDPPKRPVLLDQKNCVYTPHVVSIMAGQTLEVRNSDAQLHNVMTMPRENKGFNVGMASGADPVERVFAKPEMKVKLQCALHPWMKAYVHVLPHPFHAVTGADGTFTLKGLPPGTYELTVVHEWSGLVADPASASVTVEAGGTAKAEFTFRPRAR